MTLFDGRRLRGLDENGVSSWRGVPFAQPPIGPLRFMPPHPLQPPSPHGGEVWDATHSRPNCNQPMASPPFPDWPGLNATFSEDCLYLNVYVPTKPRGLDLPVLVYLFGGGDVVGGANDEQLDARHTIRRTRDAIVVIPNWRLGVFGWMGSWQLRHERSDNGTGNVGLEDQRAALQWVRANIGAFGGDPKRVLLMGESAGAAAVSMHVVSPRSRGLFSRAAMQSGAFVQWASKPLHVAQGIFDWVASYSGCTPSLTPEGGGGSSGPPPDPAAAAAAARAVLACLRSLPAHALTRISRNPGIKGVPYPDGWLNSSWAPTRDGPTTGIELDVP